MTEIRFIHTDHLRLGSPLTGLADCPDWLRQVAAAAVRRGVSNVFEAAVAARCQFVLIAGRLTESAQDLNAGVSWLCGLTEQLQRHGIQLVLMTDAGPAEEPVLRRLGGLLCGPEQQLDVWLTGSGAVELRVRSMPGTVAEPPVSAGRLPALCIQRAAGPASSVPGVGLLYQVAPAVRGTFAAGRSLQSPAQAGLPESDELRLASDRVLTMAAGAPQALSPDESGAWGCLLVSADPERQQLAARFCATDVVRYAQQLWRCQPEMTPESLAPGLAERSRAAAAVAGRTVVLDWLVSGQLQAGGQQAGELSETALLRALRLQLDAGHAGVWPRRLYFSDASVFSAGAHSSLAVQEFLQVMSQRRSVQPLLRGDSSPSVGGCATWSGGAAAVGLELLARVA